jgi:hypothetical protein
MNSDFPQTECRQLTTAMQEVPFQFVQQKMVGRSFMISRRKTSTVLSWMGQVRNQL